MSVKLGHARISEKGTAEGVAGDQTGHEVEISDWYSGGWLAVYRPNSETDARVIADTCVAACRNDNIGYSQDERLTLWKQAVANDFRLDRITEPCNTDCSALVSVCVNAAGILISKDMVTRNEDTVLMGTGRFTRLQASKFLNQSEYLKRGDILRKSGHTAICVEGGTGADEPVKNHTSIYADYLQKEYKGTYKAETDVYMREGAAVTYRAMCVVSESSLAYNWGYYSIDDRGVIWLLCEYGKNGIIYTGFISSTYLVRVGDVPA